MGRVSVGGIAVVFLVLAAGCSALPADSPDRTPTVTPVEVPEVRTQVAPGVWPPGSGDQPTRPVQGERLAAANDRIRANTSYRLERTVSIESREDDGRMVIRRSRRVGDGRVVESLVATGTAPLRPAVRNSTLWRNESVTATRTRLADGRVVTDERLPGPPMRHSVGLDLADRVLNDSRFDVRPAADGTVRLVADGRVGLTKSEVPVAVGPPRNASVRLVVSRDGLVVRLHVTYETTYLDERVRVTIDHRLVDVGTTPVERPAWAGRDATNE